jgi:hypothetical protein
MEKFAQTSHALLPVGHWCPVGNAVGMFSPDYLAEPLTPYPLPTKDGGLLRTIGDVRAYMLALPEERDHWKPAYRLLVQGAGAAPLTQQVYVALLKHGQLDLKEFERMTAPGGR